MDEPDCPSSLPSSPPLSKREAPSSMPALFRGSHLLLFLLSVLLGSTAGWSNPRSIVGTPRTAASGLNHQQRLFRSRCADVEVGCIVGIYLRSSSEVSVGHRRRRIPRHQSDRGDSASLQYKGHLRSTRGGNDEDEESERGNRRRTPRLEVEGGSIGIDGDIDIDDAHEVESEKDFLRRELAHLESLEEILAEIDGSDIDNFEDEDGFLYEEDDDDPVSFLTELLESIDYGDNDDDDDEDTAVSTSTDGAVTTSGFTPPPSSNSRRENTSNTWTTMSALESALMQGVVPVGAGVGDDSLPGDFGFDPLRLSERDLVLPVQSALLRILPGGTNSKDRRNDSDALSRGPRPRALILRDYREAEIRHSRLAMLAAVIWPLQEMLDRLLLDEDLYGPLLYGPVTLPYFPLFMTAVLLLLGYLDIYSMAIKEMDDIGEAYLPGDCFWDPLRILAGTNSGTKRRMQERELFNGRAAMLAVAAFAWEELVTGKPVIEIEGNALLFEPLYQVPFVQAWLDAQFSR